MAKLNRKSWTDLSRGQKASIAVQGTVQLVLMGAALWDLRRRAPERIRGSKRLWTALAFVQPFGPIAYFLFGRKT